MTETVVGINRRVGENVTTLLYRMGWTQRDLGAASGVHRATLGRKMRGAGDWSVVECAAIAAVTYAEVGEVLGNLPDWDEWCARRDSNPQPSDLYAAAGHCPLCGRHLDLERHAFRCRLRGRRAVAALAPVVDLSARRSVRAS